MKVIGVETIILQFESKRPVKDAIHTFSNPCGLVTKVLTDEGITGWAYTYLGTGKASAMTLKTLIDKELTPVILDQDPFFPKKIREILWATTEYYGVIGLSSFGISAIDMALWDIIGKVLNMPVYKLLGAYRDRVPAYAMVGWYFDTEEEFIKSCAEAIEEGFNTIKLKVGLSTLEDDVKRIKLFKREIGDRVKFMVDANQIFDEVEALRRGRCYQDLGAYWYEEPLRPQFRDALSRIAYILDVPIATGENEYTKYSFLELIKKGGVDIIQPDIRRSGGLTEWLEICAIADAYGLKVASHGGGPHIVNILCAIPNAIYMESGSLKGEKIYIEPLIMENSYILAPKSPGLGTEIREEVIEKFHIS